MKACFMYFDYFRSEKFLPYAEPVRSILRRPKPQLIQSKTYWIDPVSCPFNGQNGIRNSDRKPLNRNKNNKLQPCGHAQRFRVLGECIACQVSGPLCDRPEVI